MDSEGCDWVTPFCFDVVYDTAKARWRAVRCELKTLGEVAGDLSGLIEEHIVPKGLVSVTASSEAPDDSEGLCCGTVQDGEWHDQQDPMVLEQFCRRVIEAWSS